VELLGVHHVGINVTNVDEAVEFYVDVLGMSRRTDRPDFGIGGAWLDAAGQQVHLLEAAVPPNSGQHFALWVDDLDAVIAELRERGVGVSEAMTVGTDRQAFLVDPAGNGVELHEVG
jgi:glyoxylase I family protein